jgi:hypothetical protein
MSEFVQALIEHLRESAEETKDLATDDALMAFLVHEIMDHASEVLSKDDLKYFSARVISMALDNFPAFNRALINSKGGKKCALVIDHDEIRVITEMLANLSHEPDAPNSVH